MAVIELTNSRNIAYNEGQPTGIREFHCHPYATEQQVIALIGTVGGLPAKMEPWPLGAFNLVQTRLRVFDHSIRRDPNVTQAWIVTVTYRQRSEAATVPSNYAITPSQRGAITQRVDFSAQFEDMWRQWDTESEWLYVLGLLDSNYVPKYSAFTAESDIKGKKIDAAGYPTSVLRHKLRLTIDVVDTKRPTLNLNAIGTRNRRQFAGIAEGQSLYLGCSATELPNGMFNVSYQFEADTFYHLKQVPKRQANGYVVLDLPSNPDDVTATGQAKIVSVVQPYRWMSDHTLLNPLFIGVL